MAISNLCNSGTTVAMSTSGMMNLNNASAMDLHISAGNITTDKYPDVKCNCIDILNGIIVEFKKEHGDMSDEQISKALFESLNAIHKIHQKLLPKMGNKDGTEISLS